MAYQLAEAAPVYETLPGWDEDISGARKFSDLPQEAQAYVCRIEGLVGTFVRWISVGPEPEMLIDRARRS